MYEKLYYCHKKTILLLAPKSNMLISTLREKMFIDMLFCSCMYVCVVYVSVLSKCDAMRLCLNVRIKRCEIECENICALLYLNGNLNWKENDFQLQQSPYISCISDMISISLNLSLAIMYHLIKYTHSPASCLYQMYRTIFSRNQWSCWR